MAYDKVLAARIRSLLNNHPGLIEKKMFGGIGFMIDGNMACGVNKENLIVRVGPDRYDELLMEEHSREFDFTGRPMNGWLVVVPGGYESEKELEYWVLLGVEFSQTLPQK